MSHQLVLQVPDEIYDPLTKTASESGKAPEELAVDWLAAASRHAAKDPVEKFIGALPSGVSDWATEHDKYLGQGLTESNDSNETGS